MEKWKKPKLIVFDVNETLLNMEPVKKSINQFFKSDSAFQIWFSTLLQYAMVESINPTGQYNDFSKIAKASLLMLSEKFEIPLKDAEANDLLSLVGKLPAHKEVKDALKALKVKGYKLVALTNGTTEVLKKQMNFAGLEQYFEALYSVESVNSFKPQKITYDYVLKQQSVKPEEVIMVAAHSWDIHGANAAGLQTAFISRPGLMYYPLKKEPTFTAIDILELANMI